MLPVDGSTEIYGIMGYPVAHSLSPAMHNRAFAELSLNKIYVPFAVADVAAALQGFRALGVRGVSVTIPHKQAVLPFLDSLDPVAAAIGAVNTLVLEDGRIHGLNTDWLGANRALAEVMELAGRRVLLLGAGGSARAIGFGLQEAGAEVILASRTPERGRRLAKDLACEWLDLKAVAGLAADALVNATSVGMAPDREQSPVPSVDLSAFEVVMDIVYSPLETRLMREAARAGCRVVGGLEMLLFQGAAQFEIWTGQEAPLSAMRAALLGRLQKQG
ncbi:MAG: shikimate dehydrogenase [Desulfobulbaceae bacterium]|nr:shikimate dehydrogenase [Desulfobulbaceae bacterium]